MGKRRKKKKQFSSQKSIEAIRRENEIQEYGKLVSLRPSSYHKDKSKYTRKEKHANNTPTGLYNEIS